MSEYKLVKEGSRSVVRVDISPYDIIHDLLSTEERQELIESFSEENQPNGINIFDVPEDIKEIFKQRIS